MRALFVWRASGREVAFVASALCVSRISALWDILHKSVYQIGLLGANVRLNPSFKTPTPFLYKALRTRFSKPCPGLHSEKSHMHAGDNLIIFYPLLYHIAASHLMISRDIVYCPPCHIGLSKGINLIARDLNWIINIYIWKAVVQQRILFYYA
jgi:hypothetical protein